MTEPGSPTHAIIPEHPERYCKIAKALFEEHPGHADALGRAIRPDTDLDNAADRIVVDVITDVSYGMIRHGESKVRYALTAIANLYSRRALGLHVLPEEWWQARSGAAEILETILTGDDEGNLSVMVMKGGYLATDPEDVDGPTQLIGMAIHANDLVGEISHDAMIDWVAQVIINRTTTAKAL